jgi:hypothetical protein
MILTEDARRGARGGPAIWSTRGVLLSCSRTPPPSRRFAAVLAVVLASLAPAAPAARADDKQAAAQAAFDEGRLLMARKQYDQACARFEASQKLDPAPGTLANLATCEEARGRLATAWAEWITVRDRSARDGHARREQQARAHIDALVPRLPRLRLEVIDATVGLEVLRNGAVVPPELYAEPFPVDPGPQIIEVRGPGKLPWRTEAAAVEGQVLTVRVAPLAAAPPPPVAPSPGRTLRIAGISTAIAGGVVLGLGVKFGHDARVRSDEVSGATAWSADLDRKVSEGRTAERRMAWCYGLGAAAVVTGAVLTYLDLARGGEAPPVALVTDGEQASVVVAGAF